MIVSHAHRFIFAPVPRTGTHAVRAALRRHLQPGDHEQVVRFLDRRLPFPDLARRGHGHITLAEIRPRVGEATFAGYFRFAFVRNPFDRFVSACAFLSRRTDAFDRDPAGVMRAMLVTHRHRVLFAPQHAFVTDATGGLLADVVGRFEALQAGYDHCCSRIGIPSEPLGVINASTRGDYRSYYDRTLRDAVARRYARDLEMFGYDFDGVATEGAAHV